MFTQTEYYIIICTASAFFFVSLMMLGQARRLRHLDTAVRWLKSSRQNDADRIADLTSEVERLRRAVREMENRELPPVAETLPPPQFEVVQPPPKVIVYDESVAPGNPPKLSLD